MKKKGKLDYKEKIFSIKIKSTIPDHIALKNYVNTPPLKMPQKTKK